MALQASTLQPLAIGTQDGVMLSWRAFSVVGWVTSLIAKQRLNKGRSRPAFLGVACRVRTK